MPTKHIIEIAEDYLDGQLSATDHRLVEIHLADCPNCAQYLFTLQRLRGELHPVMKQALGEPLPPPALRRQLHHRLHNPPRASWFRSFFWTFSGQALNNLGTLAVMGLLVVGLYLALQNVLPQPLQQPETPLASQPPLEATPLVDSSPFPIITPTLTVPSPTANQSRPTPTSRFHSLGDLLPAHQTTGPPTPEFMPPAPAVPTTSAPAKIWRPTPTVPPPSGTLAFAVFDPQAYEQPYHIYFFDVAEGSQQIFPLRGVSEPALRQTEQGYRLAYRAWGDPVRALLSSDLSGTVPDQVTHFWEDAQPDWSPIENRLIFASQRESDRRWRIYTAWGDGSFDKTLNLEGQSPTFAPDGERFAYQYCDWSGKACGLWLNSLNSSPANAKLILANPQAKSPDWSPVNDQLVYMAKVNDNWDIYLTDSQGRQPRRLTTESAKDGLPVWSPDGQWLAFASDRGGDWGVWLLHLESGQLRQLFDFAGLALTSPENAATWWQEQLSWSE